MKRRLKMLVEMFQFAGFENLDIEQYLRYCATPAYSMVERNLLRI